MKFVLVLVLVIHSLLCFAIAGNVVGPVFISNEIVSIGCRFDNTAKLLNTNSYTLIGLPVWHDFDTKINGIALAPLYLGFDVANGITCSCITIINEINGVVFSGLLNASGIVNGVVVAPISFVGHGDCVQISLIAHNGIGRVSGRVLGQIALWNNVDDSSGEAPKIQIGCINSTNCRSSSSSMTFQIGIANYESMDSNDKTNKKVQIGLINIYKEENKYSENKIVQVGLLNFKNGVFCPFLFY